MANRVLVGLIGDKSESVRAHVAIPKAIELALPMLNFELKVIWIMTNQLQTNFSKTVEGVSGFWCTPGSPYQSMEGVLDGIRYARENQIPLFGTCGGFQHMLIEYARNVLGMDTADHEESNPSASTLLISKLACSLTERREKNFLSPNSRLEKILRSREIAGEFQCSYGLNPELESKFEGTPLKIVGRDLNGDARACELEDHPFFIGTLFQPELAALRGELSPLILEFLQSLNK